MACDLKVADDQFLASDALTDATDIPLHGMNRHGPGSGDIQQFYSGTLTRLRIWDPRDRGATGIPLHSGAI